MHQISFIEGVAIELVVDGFSDQDLGGLRNTRQQFVGRVGREDHRLLGLRSVRTDRMHVFIEVMKGCVGQPCFIEMESADATIEHASKLLDIVENPVIGALGDRQYAGFAIGISGLGFLRKRIRIDLLLDAFQRELFFGDRTDDPQVIAGWG